MTAPTPPSPALPSAGASLRIGPLRLEAATLEAAGLAVDVADATTGVSIQRLVIGGVRVRGPSLSLDVERAVLTGVAARMRHAAADGGAELVELAVESVELQNLQGMVGFAQRAPVAITGVHLDALQELDGLLRLFVTDALWFVDASIAVPVANGRIDFNAVDVDHIGPDSTLGVDARGVHAEAPNGRRIELVAFEGVHAPTAYGRVGGAGSGGGSDRGEIEVRPLVEAMLQAPPNAPVARIADSGLQGALRRTSLTGELRLGNGTLATRSERVVLTGREQGSNRMEISSPAIGERIVVRISDLAAISGALGLGDKEVTTGALSAVVEAHVLNAADAPGAGTRRLGITIEHSRIEGIRIAQAPPTAA